MKKVIVYYSYRGNTKSIAEMIQKSTGDDIARIETVVPYDGDYNSVVNQGQDEVNSGYCPEIKPLNIDLSKYDEVILGTPVWWYTFAPAMHTFLKENGPFGQDGLSVCNQRRLDWSHIQRFCKCLRYSRCKAGNEYPF